MMIRNWWHRAFSGDVRGEAAVGVEIRDIPVDQISASPFQPRRDFNEEQLRELAASIERVGLIEPVVVREVPGADEGYQLVVGERRLRACRMLGHRSVMAVVRAADDRDMALLALTENLQRQDLHFIEEALGFRRVLDEFDLTQEQLAQQLGLKQSTISNKIRLLSLHEEILDGIHGAGVSERHARALLRLPDSSIQASVLDQVVAEGLSVRETEKLVDRTLRGQKPRREARMHGLIRDVRIFLNGLDQTVAAMNDSGLKVDLTRTDRGDHYEVVIRVSKGVQQAEAGCDRAPEG